MARPFYCGLLNKIGFGVLPLLAFVFAGRPGLSAESAGTIISFDVPHPPAASQPLPMSMAGVSSDGHQLAVNSHYLTLDGKPWLPVIGEFHFSRYPQVPVKPRRSPLFWITAHFLTSIPPSTIGSLRPANLLFLWAPLASKSSFGESIRSLPDRRIANSP
jgi:hypothetical protein